MAVDSPHAHRRRHRSDLPDPGAAAAARTISGPSSSTEGEPGCHRQARPPNRRVSNNDPPGDTRSLDPGPPSAGSSEPRTGLSVLDAAMAPARGEMRIFGDPALCLPTSPSRSVILPRNLRSVQCGSARGGLMPVATMVAWIRAFCVAATTSRRDTGRRSVIGQRCLCGPLAFYVCDLLGHLAVFDGEDVDAAHVAVAPVIAPALHYVVACGE